MHFDVGVVGMQAKDWAMVLNSSSDVLVVGQLAIMLSRLGGDQLRTPPHSSLL